MVALLKPFGFRGHWGKQIPVEQSYLQSQYPHWQDFCELVAQWDSQNRFANPTLHRYFKANSSTAVL